MKKVKVRIAVAVDPEGDWNACGWSIDGKKQPDSEITMIARETVAEGERIYFLEAELDVPEPIVVTPTVAEVV